MTDQLISIIINVDTRPPKDEIGAMFNGVVSRDFLVDGVIGKQKFFTGFRTETILFIDEHQPVDAGTLAALHEICDKVVLSKHSKHYRGIENFGGFNDVNFLHALSLSRGSYICHVDGDCCAFSKDQSAVQEMLDMLDEWKFVSYPSQWSPRAIDDPTFGNRTWASTRFFLCKRESVKFDILERCIMEPEWAYSVYGDSPRRCNWLEHFLSLTNEDSVFYPKVDIQKLAIFCWDKYISGTNMRLNSMEYGDVVDYIFKCGGIHYPNDLSAIMIP